MPLPNKDSQLDFETEAEQKHGVQRVLAIDWLRGIVMVLMTLDHASAFFNAGRVANDSALSHPIGTELPIFQFLLRWITHLCAPSFVFLAGSALALSFARRQHTPQTAISIDRDLFIRGLILLFIELTIVSWAIDKTLLQVLYAIAGGFWAMIALRRISPKGLMLGLALWWGTSEVLTSYFWDFHRMDGGGPLPALLLSMRVSDTWICAYPALPWIAIMVLGWIFAQEWLLSPRTDRQGAFRVRFLIRSGFAALLIFIVLRGFNGYGNMGLFREDHSIAQWLHVSKYPPSLSFVALEIGLMALLLAACLVWERRGGPGPRHLLTVFGQTALFYYIVHLIILGTASKTLSIRSAELGPTLALWIATMILAYPLCTLFRRLKQEHSKSFLRYL